MEMEQYKLLAECLLPEHMLDWFELKKVQVEKQGDTQVVNLYLDENEQKPDDRDDLRPNGFTRGSVFHDFPIRGHEVLLHLRRRRWLDMDGHNVMTECDSIQESTRCSTELAAFLTCIIHRASSASDFATVLLKNRNSMLCLCRIEE